MKAAKTKRKNAHARSAIEKGFTTQLMNSVTSSPAGRRPTFFTEEKSTFIIIGVIMSQMRTAIGSVDLTSLAELDAAQGRDGIGQELSQADARGHAERHPYRQITLEGAESAA